MTTISDVFSFAASNADYWVEFLSGDEYPLELTEDETRALEAARKHIDDVAVSLLHEVGDKLATSLGEGKLQKVRFKPASTAKNRSIVLKPPKGLEGKLYRIVFSLEQNDTDATVVLFASLVVKKSAKDTFREALAQKKIEHRVLEFEVYAPGLSLKAGTSLDTLATESAQQAEVLLSGFL